MNARFLSFAFFLILSFPAFAADMEGLFMVVKGQVQIRIKGAAADIPAKIGTKVHEGDQISVGVDSRAKIVMADKNVFNLSPSTVMMIEKYRNTEGDKNVEIKLDQGKLRSTVEEKYDGNKTQFNVKTKNATAGVRGTDFITSYDPQSGASNVVTFHGTVSTSAFVGGKVQPAVLVHAGESTNVGKNQTSSPKVEKVNSQKLQQLHHETSGDQANMNGRNNGGSATTTSTRAPASMSSTTSSSNISGLSMADSHDLSPAAATVNLGTTSAPNIAPPPPLVNLPPQQNAGLLNNVVGGAGRATINITLSPQ